MKSMSHNPIIPDNEKKYVKNNKRQTGQFESVNIIGALIGYNM